MPPNVDPNAKYYHGHPASNQELVELIKHRLWREGKSMRYWLKKIREYRDMAWDASRRDDNEFAYVYAFKAAVLIFDKMPKLEEFRTVLDVNQKENLADHGRQLIELINSLTPVLQREYDQWKETERLRVEVVEARRAQVAAEAAAAAATAALQEAQHIATSGPISTVTAEDNTPQSPPPDYSNGLGMQLEAETDKQRQMRLLSADISRPNTPVSHDTPLPHELLSEPVERASTLLDDTKYNNGDDSEDYGESHWAGGRLPSYEDVLSEILDEGPGLNVAGGGVDSGLSATSGGVVGGCAGADGALTENNGEESDYNIQVVGPGGLTPLSPQFKELPPLPVDEKKALQEREREEELRNGARAPVVAPVPLPAPAEPSPSLSRRSSIAKDKKKSLQTRNPDAQPTSAAQGFNLQVLETALDTVNDQFELLGWSDAGAHLSTDVRRKISKLKQFPIQ